MPDAETPEQKVTREAEEKRLRELDDRIVRGVVAAQGPILEALNAREKPAAPVTTAAPAATIQRPTDEQIAQAQIDGNVSELARLRKLERLADQQDRQRELANLSAQGTAAFDSVSRAQAQGDPDYKRFKPEIDKELDQFRSANPGAILTPEHYRIATEIVKSRHINELINEGIEEQRRLAREKEDALVPDNSRGHEEPVEKEPVSLEEALGTGDWKREFRQKSRGVGGRTDEEELRTMFRGLKLPANGGLKQLVTQQKQVAQIEDEVGSGMGLDRDWVWTDKSKNEGHWA